MNYSGAVIIGGGLFSSFFLLFCELFFSAGSEVMESFLVMLLTDGAY